MYNIGIDLGGTAIKAAVVDENFNIISKSETKTPRNIDGTPRSKEEIFTAIYEGAKDSILSAGLNIENISNIGIGVPGVVDSETGEILRSANLGLEGVSVSKELETLFHKKIYIQNDANTAAYGETIAGAAKGYDSVFLITLGTGVGSGIVQGGKIYKVNKYSAGELGHMVIVYDGKLCKCGRKGCMEAYCSATALIRMTKITMIEHPESKMWELTDNDIRLVNGKTVFDAGRAGDEPSLKLIDKYLDLLACGCANIINTFQPEILLIGGGISAEGDNIILPLTEKSKRDSYCLEQAKKTKIAAASLLNNAGIVGAASLYMMEE